MCEGTPTTWLKLGDGILREMSQAPKQLFCDSAYMAFPEQANAQRQKAGRSLGGLEGVGSQLRRNGSRSAGVMENFG